jgi:hypothetical protein
MIDLLKALDLEAFKGGRVILSESLINHQLLTQVKLPNWLHSLHISFHENVISAHVGLMGLPEFTMDFTVLDFRFNPANHYLVMTYTINLNPLFSQGAVSVLNQFVFNAYDFLKVDQKNRELTLQFKKIKGFESLMQTEVLEGHLVDLVTLELLQVSPKGVVFDLDIKGFVWV